MEEFTLLRVLKLELEPHVAVLVDVIQVFKVQYHVSSLRHVIQCLVDEPQPKTPTFLMLLKQSLD